MDLGGVEVLLRIDGEIRSPSSVVVHHQSDPYPGGHRFFLSYRGPKAERLFEELLPHSGAISDDLSRKVLASLAFRLGEPPGAQPVEFVLNKVETFELVPGTVRISGVCSPVVRTVGAA